MATEDNAQTQAYRIQFTNNSTNSGSMMIFQQAPDSQSGNIYSVAWISKYVHPATSGVFQWTQDYNFIWSETGELSPGIQFSTFQNPKADLNTSNSITLTYDRAYNFVDQKPGDQQGSLFVQMDQTIPLDQVSVGIGMGGAPTFTIQAQPNMEAVFTPHPEYWMAFGEFETGEVLNVKEITDSVQVNFPPGVFSMNVVLNADNTWSVTPGK